MFLTVFAQGGTPAQGGTEVGSTEGLSTILMFVGIFVIMYFFMIRPQQQRQKKERSMRESIKKGDKVITIGGMHGVVWETEGATLLVKVDENIKLRFDRTAIREIVSAPAGAA